MLRKSGSDGSDLLLVFLKFKESMQGASAFTLMI